MKDSGMNSLGAAAASCNMNIRGVWAKPLSVIVAEAWSCWGCSCRYHSCCIGRDCAGSARAAVMHIAGTETDAPYCAFGAAEKRFPQKKNCRKCFCFTCKKNHRKNFFTQKNFCRKKMFFPKKISPRKKNMQVVMVGQSPVNYFF